MMRVRSTFAPRPPARSPGHPLASNRRGMSRTVGQAIAPPSAESAFIRAVEGAMEGSLLRYSRRQRLLHLAARLGLGRFEANLIIARVQHQTRNTAPARPMASARTPRPPSRWTPLAAGLGLQALLLWSAWAVFFN